MSYSENFDLENAIEETQYLLEQQYAGVEAIKKHARDVFTSISLIVALLGVLKLSEISYDFYHPEFREIMLLFAGFLYILIVFLNARLLSPETVFTPMKIEWDTFEKLYFNKTPKRILENKLENYLKAVEENRPLLDKKVKLSQAVNVIYVLIVLTLLLVLFVY